MRLECPNYGCERCPAEYHGCAFIPTGGRDYADEGTPPKIQDMLRRAIFVPAGRWSIRKFNFEVLTNIYHIIEGDIADGEMINICQHKKLKSEAFTPPILREIGRPKNELRRT